MSKAKNYKLFVLIVLLAISFALLQIGSGLVFGSHKKDFTSFHRYADNAQAVENIKKMQYPVNVTLYMSENLGDEYPSLGAHSQHILRILEKFQSAAGGKINITVKNPQPYSTVEKEARRNRIRPFPNVTADADMYFGAVDPLYGVKMPYEELLALPKRMRSYQKIFENKNSPLYALLMTAGAIMNYPSYIYGFRKPKKKYAKQDWMNLSRRLYPQTTGGSKMTDLTVREIVFQSVEDALKIIALADDFIEKGTPLPKEEFALNFMGGKSLPIAPEGYDKKALRKK